MVHMTVHSLLEALPLVGFFMFVVGIPVILITVLITLSVRASVRDEKWRKVHPPLIVDADIEYVARQLCIATRRDPDNHGEGEGWESYADRAAMMIAGIEAYEQVRRHREP